MKLVDITGMRFSRFTVVRYLGSQLWECRCDCGSVRKIKGGDLRRGDRRGCLSCRRSAAKVGEAKDQARERKCLNRIWHAMRNRCENPKNAAYANYGGRGIYVCERWQTFEAFLADVSPRPEGSTLDRRDNDGPYSPDNCRWASRVEQARNQRKSVHIEYHGQRLTLEEWAERIDVPSRRLWSRINRGMSPQAAIDRGRGKCRVHYVPRKQPTTQAISR